jgi:fructokinase
MFHFCPAIPVTIQDTVGSGDSFLAAFLASRLCGESVEETLFNAAAMGAFITTQSGACPDYTLTDFLAFRQQMRPAFLERKTAPAA